VSSAHPLLAALSEADQRAVQEALRAAVDGPFFFGSAGDFHAIFGLDPGELRRIADAWPDFVGIDPTEVGPAINDAMNNLTRFPHRCESVWSAHLSVDREELLAVFGRWRATCSSYGPLMASKGPVASARPFRPR
jgi:hypothetical protein